jgi:hypothetical protein
VLWLHIPGHPPAAPVVVPLPKYLDDLVPLPLPKEPVWAARLFFKRRRSIVFNLNLFSDKSRSIGHPSIVIGIKARDE